MQNFDPEVTSVEHVKSCPAKLGASAFRWTEHFQMIWRFIFNLSTSTRMCQVYICRMKDTLKDPRWIWLLASLSFVACQREIEVDLPQVDPVNVIEGTIFEGEAPVVFIGEAQGYFDPIDASSLGQSFLSGAVVQMTVDEITYPLDEFCTGDLPPELLETAEDLLGLPAELLAQLDLCIYTSFDPDAVGSAGHRYDLDVTIGEKTMTASTQVLEAVPLDSVWFQVTGNLDSLGSMNGIFSDPEQVENSYRWYARRINIRPEWDPMAGQVKDPGFVAPLGSAFDDEFFNGLSFEFATFRGAAAGSTAWDDEFGASPEAGYFKRGDTVVVRMCSIDEAVYQSIRSYENLILSQGSPFAPPASMISNVEGGFGLWAGYGIYQDTVICQ